MFLGKPGVGYQKLNMEKPSKVDRGSSEGQI